MITIKNIQKLCLVIGLLSTALIFAKEDRSVIENKETNTTLAVVLPQTTPPTPTIVSQNCSSAELQNAGTIPSGEMWYWQTSKYGTDTTYPATSNYIANSSGTYRLRPLHLGTNTWGAGSNVVVTLDPNAGSNWYLDTDGDGLGDPNHTIFQCLQPFGYVSNSNDQCPDVAGSSNDGGCAAEDPDNQNYIYTIAARVATTDIDTLKSSVHGIENYAYFDGLGRPKQSVAVRAGGVLTDKNALLYDWTLGNTGSTGFFNQEGTAAENTIVNGTTPFGNTDLLWECKDDNNGGGSGWITDDIAIDKTQTYRYTTWVKINDKDDGRAYHGVIGGINNLDGTANSNPYFYADDLPASDTWYLLVGIVHPHDYTGGDTGISGVYDTQGNKLIDATEFKWDATSTTTRFRNYVFQMNNASTRVHFWSPLIQKIDGSELPLSEVVTASSVITSQGATADIVTHIEYDQYGRQLREYLPFAAFSNDGRYRAGDITLVTQNYYKNKHPDDFANSIVSEVNAYSEKTIENSPLGRIFEQTAPGEDWKRGANTVTGKGYSDGHSIRFEYDTNTATEVKLYDVSLSFANNTYTPTLTGGSAYYPVGELSKTVTKDENWVVADGKNHTTEEFKNKSGQVILKRTYADIDFNKNGIIESGDAQRPHDTYYIHDDYGNLTYVLPPKAEGSTASLSTVISTLDDLSYQYKYDHRNRLVEKKIPGKGWEYIVYDKLDRPVMTQDAVQASNNEWLFTKYDVLGRVAYTGMAENNNTRTALQATFDQGTYPMYEDRATTNQNFGGAVIFYTKNVYPTSMKDVHTINYYDTYTDLPSGFTPPTSVYSQSITDNTKGLATLSKVRVLGTFDWTTTITYYDVKARPIYVYNNNAYLGATDVIESKLDDFTGKVLETKSTHQKTGNTDVVTIDQFEYDHMDRLIAQTQKINNQTTDRLVKNNYDELGQLESKLVGSGTQKGYTDVTSGITISGDEITKTSANGWNEGLATSGTIDGDGYIAYVIPRTDKAVMVGFSSTNADASYASIAYALYTRHGGEVRIYENGSYKGLFGTYNANDSFKVERINGFVHYKKNGETFYISATPSSGTLIGDVSMYSTGATIKDLHILDNSEGLQKVDYSYNVRGWLKNINNDTNNDNDLFNFSLNYNVSSGTPLYNGNISQIVWNTLNTDTSSKAYTYTYDALNRIRYGQSNDVIGNTSKYSLHSVIYDKNGNIENLYRNGHRDANPDPNNVNHWGLMDNLIYTYDNGNKLLRVTDYAEDDYGFKDGNKTGDDFSYDVNGNMTEDKNKGISNISYNYLNLPTSVGSTSQQAAISYVYDATGVKLKKTVAGSGLSTITTEYAGNHIYQNGDLQFFNHAEGYTKYNGGTTTTLIDDTFDSGTGGWNAINAAGLQQVNARLKVTAVNQYQGAHKFMSVTQGDRIEFNLTMDKGTTESVSVNILEHDSNGTIKTHNLAPDASGYIRGTYMVTEANTIQLSIKIEKGSGTDNGVSTEFFIDNVAFVKVANTGNLLSYVYQYKDHLGNVRLSYADTDNNGTIDAATEIVEESNYYPFGLKHKGYNNVVSASGNSTAQKFKFNGMELEESLGINWYEMDVRQYDPAIARWTAIDPVTHHSQSTYTGFDNNPVYWADPSGAAVEWVGDFGPSRTESSAMKHAQALFNTRSDLSGDSKNKVNNCCGNGPGGTDVDDGSNGFNNAMFWANVGTSIESGANESSSYDSSGSPITSLSSSLFFSGFSREYYRAGASALRPLYGNNFGQGALARTNLKSFVRNRMTPYLGKLFLDKVAPNINPFPGNPTPSFWKTNRLINIGGRVAGGVGAVGLGYQGYGVYNYFYDPTNSHVVHPGKFGADSFFTGAMYYGGPVGLVAGIIYFGVDATIGWDNAFESAERIQNETQKIIPGWSIFPRGPKQP